MAENDKTYLSIAGIVQFDPEGREVAGKKVRSVNVQTFGAAGGTVYLTVWPSHADVEINKGDVLFVGGSYAKNEVDTDTGTKVYHNLSVTNLVKLPGNGGKRDETVNTSSAAPAGDEPF